MIPPVSVCHQLSWKGRPKASSPQTTPAGCSGSPTLARKRSAGKSCSRTSSTPAFIIIRIAVGAVYQTETRCSSRIEYQRCASNSPSSAIIVTPFESGEMIPYEVPVTQPGSAVHQKMSPAWRSSASFPVMWWETIASWTCTAPLGFPVVPLVKCTSATSSGSVGPISYVSAASASRRR